MNPFDHSPNVALPPPPSIGPIPRRVVEVMGIVREVISTSSFPLARDQREGIMRLATMAALHADGVENVIRDGHMTLSGPAGSGKTTIVRLLVAVLKRLQFEPILVAPTGKAAARLREAFGNDAETSTVHSVVYGRPVDMGVCPGCKTESEVFAVPASELRDLGHVGYKCPACKVLTPLKAEHTIERRLNFRQAADTMPARTVLVVDEASMVTAQMHADLVKLAGKRRDTLLLYVGDHKQLPPVEEKEDEEKPHPHIATSDVLLTTVHRQAEGSTILTAAGYAAQGEWRKVLRMRQTSDFAVEDRTLVKIADWTTRKLVEGKDSITLAYSNKTRKVLNDLVAASVGQHLEATEVPQLYVGSRLQCLANAPSANLLNGELITVAKAEYVAGTSQRLARITTPDKARYYVLPDYEGVEYRDFQYRARPFRIDPLQRAHYSMRDLDISDRLIHFGLGYAITVHRSQGSAWEEIAYVWDAGVFGMAYREPQALAKHLYTGLTRAKKRAWIFRVPKATTP